MPFTYAGTHLLDDSYLNEHLECIKSALSVHFMQHHRQAMIKISVHVVDLDLEDPELKIRDQGKVLKLIRAKSRRPPPHRNIPDIFVYPL